MSTERITTAGVAPEGYRLPAAAAPGAVRLLVTDLTRSAEYYQRVIGLQVQNRSTSVVTLGVTAGSAPLVVLETRSGVRPASRRSTLGLYHFAILLPDRVALGRAGQAQAGDRAGSGDRDRAPGLILHARSSVAMSMTKR